MTDHTPGTWKASDASGRNWQVVRIGDKDGMRRICTINNNLTAQKANAALIAAAPDLLSALEKLVDGCKTASHYPLGYEAATTAIAKARGQ